MTLPSDRRLAGPAARGAAGPDDGRGRQSDAAARSRRGSASPILQCGIAVRRVGPRGWLKVTGELTAMTRRHLDDFLDLLITEGVRQITVCLATAEGIDQAGLRLLRIAQTELHNRGGELLVTASRATTRRTLTCLTRTEAERIRAS